MKKFLFKNLGKSISLLLYIPGVIKIYNLIYESSGQKLVNVMHEYVEIPKRKIVWRIKLRNGKYVKTVIDPNEYKTKQFAIDYKWYSPGISIVENIILKHLKENVVYLDIGANLGMRSLCALSNEQKTIMFEPNVEVAKINKERCDLNNFTNYIIIQKGVSNKSGVVNFSIDDSSYKSSINPSENTTVVRNTSIETISLDDWISEFPDIQKNIFVKVDIEGHELELTLGAKKFLSYYSPTFIMEINQKGSNFNKIYEIFNNYGYNVFSLAADRWDNKILRPIDSIDENLINRAVDFLFIKDENLIKKLSPIIEY